MGCRVRGYIRDYIGSSIGIMKGILCFDYS